MDLAGRRLVQGQRAMGGGDKGPHRGVGFRNGQKDDMAMGRITGEYFRELMLTQIF